MRKVRANGKQKSVFNDYSAVVRRGKVAEDGSVLVEFTIPGVDGIVFMRTYSWQKGIFSTLLSFKSQRKDRSILHTALEVVMPQEIRRGGRYESWGAGHGMEHKQADDLAIDVPADSCPVLIFECFDAANTFLHYRYKYQNRYIQIGAGAVTVAGFGDRRTIFTSTGWVIGDGIFEVNPERSSGAVESRLIYVKGSLINAFDAYLEQDEVKDFRSKIKRPAWLADVRLFCSQAWVGFFGDTSARIAEHYQSLIREGIIQMLLTDSDFRWGDFPTGGEVRNQFGARLSYDDLLKRLQAIRDVAPGIKLAEYTWLWSVHPCSEIYRKHPEWFITYDVNGNPVNFFPDWGPNYYRLLRSPEAWTATVNDIVNFVNATKSDIWYLDGGGSPATIDWANVTIDEPDNYDRLFADIRRQLQTQNPEHAIFFNSPENPLGDVGFLESMGGIMTNNWRDGASWMFKFKLWQRNNPLFSPLYIYWDRVNDRPYRFYSAGIGLMPTYFPELGADSRRDTALISAYQQSRFVRLVDAKFSPNWRHDPNMLLEVMPLSLGKSGWLFVSLHSETPQSETLSVELKPLGLTATDRPVYQYAFNMVPHALHAGVIPEPEEEANYIKSGWQGDFMFSHKFLGSAPWSERVSRKFELAGNSMMLFYLTQSPALVYSVDNLRCQLPLSETFKVAVEGVVKDDAITLHSTSQRKVAELIANLPAGKIARSVTVNGKEVDFAPFFGFDSRWVRFAVPEGEASITVALSAAVAASAEQYKLSAAADNQHLTLTVNGEVPQLDAGYGITIVDNLTHPVWSSAAHRGNVPLRITLPDSITGGEYCAQLYNAVGDRLAETKFTLAGRAPKAGPVAFTIPSYHSENEQIGAINPVPGVQVKGYGREWGEKMGTANVYPQTAQVILKADEMPAFERGVMSGALNMQLKRYVKIQLSGNYAWFAKEGAFSGDVNVSFRNGEAPSGAALTLDFVDKQGRMSRTFAGVGLIFQTHNSAHPKVYGTAEIPERIATISDFAGGKSGKESEELWIDCYSLGAPADWSGEVWLGLCIHNSSPDRRLELKILESREQLPEGVTAAPIFYLKGAPNEG